MTTGVTPTGFVPELVTDLVSDVEQAELTNIDPLLDTSPEEPIGQINGIFCEKLAELWELGGTAYNGMNRDTAEGPQLDNIGSLTGTKRLTATPSSVLQTCVFSATGSYGIGALVANVSGQPQTQFANGYEIDVTLSGGTYTATQNGVVLATSGSLNLTVPGCIFLCTQTGPTIANGSTLTAITTPVTGWVSTTNPLAATLGTLIESDTDYRLRQENEIAAVGSGNPDAMRADILNVPGVIQAFVIENTGTTVDGYGNPPHTFLVVVWDGSVPAASDTQIAQAMWDDKPTGIAPSSAGTITDGVAVDSNGGTHVMPFDRATQEPVYLTITCTMMPNQTMNATVAAAIKQAIVDSSITQLLPDFSDNPAYLGLGDSVIQTAIISTILQAGLGVLDVPTATCFLGFSPSPGGTSNLTVTALQIATMNTANMVVNGF